MKSSIKHISCIVLFFSLSLWLNAQTDAEIAAKFIDFSLENDTLQLPARLFIPENYDAQVSYPLLLILHSSGEVGTDNYAQITWAHATSWGRDAFQAEHPCFLLAPQCTGSWSVENTYDGIMCMLDSIITTYSIDTNRIYISGHSLGAIGTWSYLEKNPDFYAAAFTVCGYYQGNNDETYNLIKSIRHIPVWNYHGIEDVSVEIFFSRRIFDKYPAYMEYPLYTHNQYRRSFSLSDSEIKHCIDTYTDLIYSEVPGWGHGVSTLAFEDQSAKTWLFRQRKHAPGNIQVTRKEKKIKVSGTEEFTFQVSGLTDSVSIWSGQINSADWHYFDKIDAASGQYYLDSEQLDDHPLCLLKFIAHDTAGYAIGKDYSDTLCIDNDMNGPPYIGLINDYFLEQDNIYSDTYSMSLLISDPESDALHLTFSVSYDNGASYSPFEEKEVGEGLVVNKIPLNQFKYSERTIIKVDVSDGESTRSDSTLYFLNGNGITHSGNMHTQETVDIYPNPAEKDMIVKMNTQGLHFIEVYSMSGQLRLDDQFHGSTYTLNVSSFTKGIYFICISSENSITRRMFIKQ